MRAIIVAIAALFVSAAVYAADTSTLGTPPNPSHIQQNISSAGSAPNYQDVSSGNPFPVLLGAGTNNIGSTTFTRRLILTGTFVPASSYSTGNNMGGLQVLTTTLAAGTTAIVNSIRAIMTATTVTVAGTITANLFNALPASTFSDGSSVTLASADAAKWTGAAALNTANTSFTGAAIYEAFPASTTISLPWATQVDPNGDLYLAFQATGTTTLSAPSHYSYTVELLY